MKTATKFESKYPWIVTIDSGLAQGSTESGVRIVASSHAKESTARAAAQRNWRNSKPVVSFDAEAAQ